MSKRREMEREKKPAGTGDAEAKTMEKTIPMAENLIITRKRMRKTLF